MNLGAGVVLFGGTLVGGLAATGRLNPEGVANIPVLNALFPAPETPEGAPGENPAHAAPAGETAPQSHDVAQADAETVVRSKVGRSLHEPEPRGADAHGGGHGEGDGGEQGGHDTQKGTRALAAGAGTSGARNAEQAVMTDMQHFARGMKDPKSPYTPGAYFTFEGMPAGLTTEQINEAWQRVQGELSDIDRRKTALELREQELQELADDVARRQKELGAERNKIEQLHRLLDTRIQKFQDQVKLVRNDEVAALKRNAQTLASFESTKAAELIEDQWKSERGQDEVLKVLEFMERNRLNEILAVLPNPLVQDLLKKRMRVTKESAASEERR
jgi:hypothetical protein